MAGKRHDDKGVSPVGRSIRPGPGRRLLRGITGGRRGSGVGRASPTGMRTVSTCFAPLTAAWRATHGHMLPFRARASGMGLVGSIRAKDAMVVSNVGRTPFSSTRQQAAVPMSGAADSVKRVVSTARRAIVAPGASSLWGRSPCRQWPSP